MKKLFAVLMALAVVAGTAACAAQSTGTAPTTAAATQAPASTEKITVRIGHNQPDNSPEQIGLLKMKEVAEAQDPRLYIEIYPAGQLGTNRDQVESTQMGTIEMALQPLSFIVPFAEDVRVFDFPYLVPTEGSKVVEFYRSDLAKEGLARVETAGMKGINLWFSDYKRMTISGGEIHTPNDLKGKKIRVMDSDVLMAQYEAWGANPIPLAYTELYSALQQKVVDGEENQMSSIVMNKFYEVQDCVVDTLHGTMTYALIANMTWYNKLDDTAKAALQAGADAGMVAEYDKVVELRPGYDKEVTDAGKKLYALTADEIAQFKEASAKVYDEQPSNDWQRDYLKRVLEFTAK